MLRVNIERILREYLESRNQNFADHPLANVLRHDLPNDLKSFTDNPHKYKFAGSAGQGNWTYLPWVAVFNKKITETAQKGYYVVYLFREDMKGVYLSLNQGMTDVRNNTDTTEEAKNLLRSRAKDFRNKLKDELSNELLKEIDLGIENSPNAPFYEAGNIYAKYYSIDDLPSEDVFEADYKDILKLYDSLVSEGENIELIGDPKEIKEAQDKFLNILYTNYDEKISTEISLGPKMSVEAHWSNDLGIWVVNRELNKNLYYNAFGIKKPETNTITRVVSEINIQKDGVNGNAAGVFGKDPEGNIYLIHRGNIAGYSKTEFFEKYKGETTQIQDGDKKTEVVIIGSLSDPKLPEKVSKFIFEVDRMKRGKPKDHPEETFSDYLKNLGYYFSPKIIENFLLSLKIKPFVILTGNSGTGKTKMAQLFASYINRDESNVPVFYEKKKVDRASQQYIIVPVGANWTENRHLLGFFNVITKGYQTTPALELILESQKNVKRPYFLVLDEMNLSHVERYFSDFLSAMESEESIQLHSKNDEEIPSELNIPRNLLVIGTVNVDETTYMFSPKVLDRANTIEFSTYSAKNYILKDFDYEELLGDIEYLENPLSDLDTRNFTVEQLEDLFKDVKINSKDYLWTILAIEIQAFQDVLSKAGFDFGFRVINEILRFMFVAWTYEGKKNIWDNWMRYFDAQIKQKMLPKLHGSQRVLEDVLKELFELCYDGTVESAPRYIKDIESDPDVKYLSSALKIQEMDKVLNEQRYVSFIN